MALHQIGIIGLGKIAQDQHLPVIKANPDFELLAVSSQRGLTHEDARYTFQDYRETPEASRPRGGRRSARRRRSATRSPARRCVAGKSVLLEKPPAATLSELEDLQGARREGRQGRLHDLALPSTTRPSTRPRRLSPAGRSSGFS